MCNCVSSTDTEGVQRFSLRRWINRLTSVHINIYIFCFTFWHSIWGPRILTIFIIFILQYITSNFLFQLEELQCTKLPPPPEWASSPPGCSALPGGGSGCSALPGGGSGCSALPGGGSGCSALPGGGSGCSALSGGGASMPSFLTLPRGGRLSHEACTALVPGQRTVRFESQACTVAGCGVNRAASLDRKKTKSNSHIESIV